MIELQPNERAELLVGQFLREFATTEQLFSDVLGRMMDLQKQQWSLLLEHVPVARKIAAFKVAYAEYDALPSERKHVERAVKTFQVANDLRNIVAHQYFEGRGDSIVFTTFGADDVKKQFTFEDFGLEAARLAGGRRPVIELRRRLDIEQANRLATAFMEKYELRQKLSAALAKGSD